MSFELPDKDRPKELLQPMDVFASRDRRRGWAVEVNGQVEVVSERRGASLLPRRPVKREHFRVHRFEPGLRPCLPPAGGREPGRGTAPCVRPLIACVVGVVAGRAPEERDHVPDFALLLLSPRVAAVDVIGAGALPPVAVGVVPLLLVMPSDIRSAALRLGIAGVTVSAVPFFVSMLANIWPVRLHLGSAEVVGVVPFLLAVATGLLLVIEHKSARGVAPAAWRSSCWSCCRCWGAIGGTIVV